MLIKQSQKSVKKIPMRVLTYCEFFELDDERTIRHTQKQRTFKVATRVRCIEIILKMKLKKNIGKNTFILKAELQAAHNNFGSASLSLLTLLCVTY